MASALKPHDIFQLCGPYLFCIYFYPVCQCCLKMSDTRNANSGAILVYVLHCGHCGHWLSLWCNRPTCVWNDWLSQLCYSFINKFILYCFFLPSSDKHPHGELPFVDVSTSVECVFCDFFKYNKYLLLLDFTPQLHKLCCCNKISVMYSGVFELPEDKKALQNLCAVNINVWGPAGQPHCVTSCQAWVCLFEQGKTDVF